MNFSEKLDKFVERGAEKYEVEFHNRYPEGMTVANYCNSDVPWNCFDAGANSLKPIVLKLIEALDCYTNGEAGETARKTIQEVEKMIEVGNEENRSSTL